MKTVRFVVKPNIPDRLKPLEEIARNLWISWNYQAITLFIRLNYEAWLASRQNPVRMLGTVAQERLQALAADDSFMSYYSRTYARYKDYLAERTWWDRLHDERPLVAYFSAEFGLAECLPIYSGGLGVLAGHHLKSASDLGVPLVGVGLLYQQGYFRQYLNTDGWQQEHYPENEVHRLPLREAQRDLVMVYSQVGSPESAIKATPPARPSRPSVRLTALEMPTIRNAATGI